MILTPSTIIPLLGIQSGQTILDIGSSIGFWAKPLSPIVGPTGKIIAVDFHPETIDRLNHDIAEGGITNIAGIVGDVHDLENLPIKRDSCDVVLLIRMGGVIEDQLEHCIPELLSFAKPEGKLIVIDHAKHQTVLDAVLASNTNLHVMIMPAIAEKTGDHFIGYTVTRATI